MAIDRSVPAIPPPPQGIDLQLRQFLNTMKEAVEVRLGHRGNALDRGVTLRELSDAGIVTIINNRITGYGDLGDIPGGGGGPTGEGYDPNNDYSAVPQPVNVVFSTTVTSVYITWNKLTSGSLNRHIRLTEIWRGETNVLANAALIGTSSGEIYADTVEPAESWWYWVRHVSYVSTPGPWWKLAGDQVTTSLDPSYVLSLLDDAITAAQLEDNFTVINKNFLVNADYFAVYSAGHTSLVFGVDTAANRVVMSGAFIQNATITNAKIVSLVVDKITGNTAAFVNANILNATITSAKIANSIQSDDFVAGVSGWRITRGVPSFIEIGSGLFRGTLTATVMNGGTINGARINGAILAAGTQLLTPTEADTGNYTILCYAQEMYRETSVTSAVNIQPGEFITAPPIPLVSAANTILSDYKRFKRYHVTLHAMLTFKGSIGTTQWELMYESDPSPIYSIFAGAPTYFPLSGAGDPPPPAYWPFSAGYLDVNGDYVVDVIKVVDDPNEGTYKYVRGFLRVGYVYHMVFPDFNYTENKKRLFFRVQNTASFALLPNFILRFYTTAKNVELP